MKKVFIVFFVLGCLWIREKASTPAVIVKSVDHAATCQRQRTGPFLRRRPWPSTSNSCSFKHSRSAQTQPDWPAQLGCRRPLWRSTTVSRTKCSRTTQRATRQRARTTFKTSRPSGGRWGRPGRPNGPWFDSGNWAKNVAEGLGWNLFSKIFRYLPFRPLIDRRVPLSCVSFQVDCSEKKQKSRNLQ